ncbi:MAG: ABC transporter substrate-binding protein [Actinomycetota bacterium]|nr:ABC transporter substrate-binding protein [Actinomycetota bacterium]
MEFTILGSVEARRDGRAVPLGGPKQRALLAILLLNANTPVSRDRLVDGLWGERPPPSAVQTLDSYLSKLRRALGADRIARRASGYVVRVEPGELDFHRFEALVTAAHNARGPADTSRLLAEALALWQGTAFSDLLYEPFANEASERMEERRLGAIEERLDADLALGSGPELIDEIEALVRKHPLRERLLGQLMLALYRAGRQADALAALQRARHGLAEQLGLEPGPQLRELERLILQHDAGLDAARSPAPAAVRTRRHRRVLAGAATATALAAVVIVAVFATGGGGGAPLGAKATDRLLAIDAASGTLADSIELPDTPSGMTFGLGSLWITSPNRQEVLRVDPSSREVTDRIPVAGQPGSIVTGAGAIWVASTLGGSIQRIDPATDRATQTIRLGGANTGAIAFYAGRLWVADTIDHALVVVDARTGEITNTYSLDLRPTAVVAGPAGVFAADSGQHAIVEIDQRTGRQLQEISVGNGPVALAEADGSLWVANSLDATVTRVDPQRGVVARTIAVGSGPAALAVARGAIYVANQYSRNVSRIDLRTNRVTTTNAGGEPATLAAGMGKVWVASAPSSAAHRGGSLAILSPQRFTTIDPALQFSAPPPIFGKLAYDGLVTFESAPGPAGLRLIPDLALALPTPENGGTTYRFRLRRGIRYANGRAVRAADFRRGIERLFLVDSPGVDYFAGIVGAERCTRRRCNLAQGIEIDDAAGTVVFHLRTPDPDFLFKLTPLEFAAPIPPGIPNRDVGTAPMPGTGPYRILHWTRREIRFVRNPYFHEWSHAAQPDGVPDQIVWRFTTSPASAERAVAQGRADWIFGAVELNRLHSLELRFPSQIHTNPAFVFEFVPLNTHRPPFDDVRVRRALNFAIDRAKIARMYGGPGIATPWCQAIASGMEGYERRCPYTAKPNARGTWTAPDLATARRLVAASGTRGEQIDVWGSTDEGTVPQAVVRYFASVLRSLGYRTRLHLVPRSSYTASLRRTLQLSVDGDWLADYPAPSSYVPGFFGCHGGYSNGFVCDATLERQIASASTLQVRDPHDAAGAWARVDRRITDQALFVPTVQLEQPELVSKRVRNYEYHPVWGFIADQAWLH